MLPRVEHVRGAAVPALAASLLLGAACTNFHVVEDGRFYRCAQPSERALVYWIEKHGIRTVVRLRGGKPGEATYDADAGAVATTGATLVHIPMTAGSFPPPERLLALWDTFATAEYPMLVHCMAGADRTGLASALYVLQRTGDLHQAKQQLCVLFGHVGVLGGTDELDDVLRLYEPWHGKLPFPDWVRQHYRPPR